MLLKITEKQRGVKTVLNNFLKELKRKPGVVGIILLGSVASEGIIDEYSDVDLAIFVDTVDTINWLPKFEFSVSTSHKSNNLPILLNFNVHQQLYSREMKSCWSDVKAESYKKGRIVFDPQGQLKKLLIQKTNYTHKMLLDRLVLLSTKLPPYLEVNPLKQSQRGHYVQAHSILNKGIDLLVETIFVLNHDFIPHDKWKIMLSFKLKWLPKNYEAVLNEALLIKSHTSKDIHRRMNVLQPVTREVFSQTEKRLGKTMWQSYNEACSSVLERQLKARVFSDQFTHPLRKDFSQNDMDQISGFINYHLVDNRKSLVQLLTTKKTFVVQGADACKRALSIIYRISQ